MEKYEFISVVGEGAYGKVLKCRHKESGQLVAIKRFLETEEDRISRKMALREIRVLKKLRHENLVNMIEVFRKKRRFYLVFEFMSHTLLTELEEQQGIGEEKSRRHIFQIIRAIDFCHENNIVHRDVKPENVLISSNGVVKLCDFGFARFIAFSNEPYTDYVATRWYRAPELLVGDSKYGRAVDIWAIGCIILEMLTGDPLFPGDSDLDQLYRIIKLLGGLTLRQIELAKKCSSLKDDTSMLNNMCGENFYLCSTEQDPEKVLSSRFPSISKYTIEIAAGCLRMDPSLRPHSSDLLRYDYFHHDNFTEKFLVELKRLVQLENQNNMLLQRSSCYNEASLGKNLGPRKSSYQNMEWSMELNEISNPQNQYEAHSKPDDHESQVSTPYPKIFNARGAPSKVAFMDGGEKITVPYKRDMMPNTHIIKPINGRLVVDRNLTLPCHNRYQHRRYICEDLSLPEINYQHGNESKKKKQEPFNLINESSTIKPSKSTECRACWEKCCKKVLNSHISVQWPPCQFPCQQSDVQSRWH